MRGSEISNGGEPPMSAGVRAETTSSQVWADDFLKGRTYLVTGASSGLGRAAAAGLAKHGANLILLGRQAGKLLETAESLKGEDHVQVAVDFANPDQVAEIVKNAAVQAGPIDGLFHSAGAYLAMPARMTKHRQIEAMFRASVWGAFGVARAVAQKGVMRDGGSVVFMSSVAAQRGHTGTTAYAGAKATILGMVPVLAIELAPRRIRVNSILAATIETEMHLNTIANLPDELVQDGLSRHLLGFGKTDDVTNAVLFLMSDASRWITGTALTVDGGYMAK